MSKTIDPNIQNDVLQQLIKTIQADIMLNPDFIKGLMENYKVKKENIDENLILQLMSYNSPAQAPPVAKNNQPKEIAEKGKKNVAKPIIVASAKQSAKVVADLLAGNNVYLMGKAGSGKTYMAEAIAESVLNQPKFMITCSQWTSPIEIRGGQTITGYVEGELIKAWAQGGVLILDELPKLDPNTAGLLNAALAESSAQPKYNDDGTVDESTIPIITNGKGDKIKKGSAALNESTKYRFCVIATGNTDMMSIGSKYGGNQKQDYSLVDRFAGSYYYLDADEALEIKLTYPYVFGVCQAMRNFLNKETEAIQSISLRTMLNFNRTYEQQMLRELGTSPYVDEVYDNDGKKIEETKTIEDSIISFIKMMDNETALKLQSDASFKAARAKTYTADTFIERFKEKYHLDPQTGDVVKRNKDGKWVKA